MKITIEIENPEFKPVRGLATAYLKRVPNDQYAVIGYTYDFPDDIHPEMYRAKIEIFRKDDPDAIRYYREIRRARAKRKAEKAGKTQGKQKQKESKDRG